MTQWAVVSNFFLGAGFGLLLAEWLKRKDWL